MVCPRAISRVLGTSTGGGNGVYGRGEGGSTVGGVVGYSVTGYAGVYGFSGNPVGRGVAGRGSGIRAADVDGFNDTGPSVLGGSTTNFGVFGNSASGYGVYGTSYGADSVRGDNNVAGKSAVAGIHTGAGVGNGIYGVAPSPGYAPYAQGNFGASGSKSSAEPPPADASKEIRYASLEGREVDTYFRGSGHLVNGRATIEVPEDFRLVTSAEGLTVVATPSGELAMIACVSRSIGRIEIRGSADVDFDYLDSGACARRSPTSRRSRRTPRSYRAR